MGPPGLPSTRKRFRTACSPRQVMLSMLPSVVHAGGSDMNACAAHTTVSLCPVLPSTHPPIRPSTHPSIHPPTQPTHPLTHSLGVVATHSLPNFPPTLSMLPFWARFAQSGRPRTLQHCSRPRPRSSGNKQGWKRCRESCRLRSIRCGARLLQPALLHLGVMSCQGDRPPTHSTFLFCGANDPAGFPCYIGNLQRKKQGT